MSILRKVLLVFVAGLLPIFLFALAIDTGIIRTAGSSKNIKKILADSGIYNSAVASVLDQAKTSGSEGEGISLTDPNIKTIAEKTFTPQFLQENTEQVLDSLFLWLDGKTTTPNFRIDLSGLKSTFAAETAKAAQARAATLPACPAGLSGSADSYEPFSATCLPGGTTPASVAAEIQNSLSQGEGFLKDPIITADMLKTSGSDQSVFADQLKDVPGIFQKVKQTPIILAILSLVTMAAVILLSSPRRRGFRRVGITLLSVGIFLLVFAWGLNYGVNQKALPRLSLDNKVLQDKLKTLASDITQSVDKTYWLTGGVYTGLGALAIGGSMFIHRRGSLPAGRQSGSHIQPEPVVHEAPKPEKPTPAPPKKKSIKIQ